MAMVSAVAVVFIFVFLAIQLFHFVQQNRYHTAMQMESVAYSIRQPLSAAVLHANIQEAETILKSIYSAGIVARADVVLPNQFQALHVRFLAERAVPVMVTRLFELPVQISLPLYSTERPSSPQPLAYLVLQADAWSSYKFILSTLATLVTTYFLLALILSVAITWCINRLIVHPLRHIARELDEAASDETFSHRLTLPFLHHDDEIGMLVRSYNRNRHRTMRRFASLGPLSTRPPVTPLPNKAQLMVQLEQSMTRDEAPAVLMIVHEMLQVAMPDEQQQRLLNVIIARINTSLPPGATLAGVDDDYFALIALNIREPWHVMRLGQTLMAALAEPIALSSATLPPTASIGIAMYDRRASAEQLYRCAISAALSAQQNGKNQIQFFESSAMERVQQRLNAENDVLNELAQQAFAVWLQPQVALKDGEVVSANVLLRQRQPDGRWALPDGLAGSHASLGVMMQIDRWVLDASCRLLTCWQRRGIMMPLAVKVSAQQLQHENMSASLLALLHHYQIKPGTLILEVTESSRIASPDEAVTLFRPLRDAGVKVALDDIGIGYSSLRQLHERRAVPLDYLTIDNNIVNALPENGSIALAMVTLAHALNLGVMAEGIAHAAQRDWLLAAGVALGQGGLFAPAMTPEQFDAAYLAPLMLADHAKTFLS